MNPATFSALPINACTAAMTGAFGPDRLTHTTFDAAGRTISTTRGYGTLQAVTETVGYSANGRTSTLTDGAGNVSIMEYDGFDRMVKLRYPNPTGGGTSSNDYEAWAWNAAGRPVASRNRAGQVTYLFWDLLGRVTSIDAPSGTMDVAKTYDNFGRTLTSTGNNQTLTMTWDALSRPVSEIGPLGAMSYEYDAGGQRSRITWPDAFYVTYSRDLSGAVTLITENGVTSGPGVLAQYTYDNLGQLTGIIRAGGTGAGTNYGYDAFARLTSLAHNARGTTNDVTLGLSYNPAGQIASRSVSNNSYNYTPAIRTTEYDVNGLNRVTSIDSTSVTYDGNGETTGIAANTYGFDAAGRLTSANAGAGAANFTFDPASRLYQSSVGGFPTRFQYAGAQLVAEYNGSTNVVARHIPGRSLDDIAASWDLSSASPIRLWPLVDERGSVITRSNSTGDAFLINLYDEYGVPASGNAGRFQYTGQAWLAEAGAYHYRARTYLPQIGRFLQTDPIVYAAGTNIYGYVRGDPVNLVDPLGLQDVTTVGDVFVKGSCPVGTKADWSGRCRSNLSSVSQINIFGGAPSTTSFAAGQDNGWGGYPLSPPPEQIEPGDDENEIERKIDFNVCRTLRGAVASACYQSAAARDRARQTGQPLPPLITTLRSPSISENEAFAIGAGVGLLGVAACVILEPCGALVVGGGLIGLGLATSR